MNTKLRRTLTRLVALLVILTLLPTGIGLADSGRHPEVALPFGEESILEETLGRGLSTAGPMTLTDGDLFQNGADRLAALQNNDGGWDWPLNDGNPGNVSPKNTLGPIAQGLAMAYLHTGDPDHLAALQDAGTLLLGKTNNFSPSDGYLAATLDDLVGGTVYTDHVTDNFYGPLAAGTYNRNGAGTLYDTAGYVNLIRTSRAGTQANLAAWDIGMGLVGAAAAGADTTAWIAGVKAEIDELNTSTTVYYDVIGLAGAIYGLAYVGQDYNPSAGAHAAAESLADLGVILADYQLATGGFTWHSAYQGEGEDNEAIQETAYAILALDKLNRTTYLSAIQNAADYMESVQLGTGGWENYTASGENNEITGEALWGIHVAYPLAEVWACPSGDCGHPGAGFNTIQAAIDAVQVGGTVHVTAGSYAEAVVVDKVLTLDGAGSESDSAANTIISGSGSGVGLSLPAGSHATQRVIVKDLRVTGFGTGLVASSYNTLTNVASVNNITYGINLNPLQDLIITGSKFNNNGVGLKIASTASVDGVTITNSEFNGNTNHGWYSDKGSTSDSNITNLNISYTTFNDNLNKGFYTEKLSNAVFDHITIDNSGTGGALNHRAGMDLNLKYGDYTNIQILNSTITNNGTGDPNGGGILIKARSTGSYAGNPATLEDVTLTNLVVTGNGGGAYAAGIRIGESNNSLTGIDAGPTNVTITNSVITGNASHGVRNATAGATVDASPNWWGSISPDWAAAVSGDVNYTPWCADAGCTRFTPSILISPSGTVTDWDHFFRWTGVSDATWYLLEVQTAGGTEVLRKWYSSVQAGCSADSSCAVSAGQTMNLANGDYKWRVQDYGPYGYGPVTLFMDFSLLLPTPPGPAALVSPSGDITDTTPVYTWNEVSSATWYYLWVKRSSGSPIKQWYEAAEVCTAGVCSVEHPTALGAGAHTWWIQTWSQAGHGPWSDGMSFSLPVIPLPAAATLVSPSGTITDTTPVYTWDEVPGADWYYLWVKRPSGAPIKQWFEAAAVCSGGTCSVEPATALGAGTHTWWIQTWNTGGFGPWSDGLSFTVTAPGQAALVSPSGDITETMPTFTWNAVPGADWYYLWVDGPSGDGLIKQWFKAADVCTGNTCYFTPDTALDPGEHTWWVRTWNSAGYGPWSPEGSFTVSP